MNDQNEENRTYDMAGFTIRDATECGRAVRTIGEGAARMEETSVLGRQQRAME